MTSQNLSQKVLRRFPGRRFGAGLILSLLFTGDSSGQVPFGRYFSDQRAMTVQIGGTRFHGSMENGNFRLSEREAVAMALENNLDVNLARFSPLSADWAIRELRAAYDPEAFFNWNWIRRETPTTSILQGRESLTTILTTGESGVRQLFPTGTSAELYFNVQRDRTSSFFSNINPAINTNLGILVRQNLLEGFGKDPTQYQIEISRNNLEISEQEFRRAASNLIEQVQRTYWDLRFSIEDVGVKQKSLDAAQALLDQNHARLEVGTAARLDVAQAAAEVALRQDELTRAQASRLLLQDELVRLISTFEDPRDFPATILPEAPLNDLRPIESFPELRTKAGSMRPELQQSELDLANQKVALEATRNELRPTLDLVAGYEQFGLGGHRRTLDFSGGITDPRVIEIVPGGIADSLDGLFSSRFYGYLVGLDLRIPIGNDQARARNAQAQISYDRSMLGKRSLLQAISLEIRAALTRVETSRASITSSTAALQAAEERRTAEEARFEVGVGTTRELIEAQRDELLAASLVVRSRTELAKSHAALDRAVGRGFERHGIVLDESLGTNVKAP